MRMRNPKDMKEVLESCNFFLEENLFSNDKPIHLEIGMGKGDFILQMALNNPDINFIGIEKYSSVMSVAIKKLRDYELPNLKVLITDVKDVPEYLYHKIDTIYLNFSDPWPKSKHEKRRLTYKSFLEIYDKLFVSDAKIIMKTDNLDLFLYSKESFLEYGYHIIKESRDLHKEDTINYMTEYEKKFASMGVKINYIMVEKKDEKWYNYKGANMKIKYIFLSLFMFLLCGCENVQNESVESIVSELATSTNKVNQYHTGYSYYLPLGMKVSEYSSMNEVLETEDNVYYLYVDLISYNNKTKKDYEVNNEAYYSKKLESDNKYGYIEISLQENEKYLIEIMFNYAKIEVMVEKKDINVALNYAVNILKSIHYNDGVIANLLGNDVISFQEQVYNIFDSNSSEKSNYLKAIEEDQYIEPNVKDTDLIN